MSIDIIECMRVQFRAEALDLLSELDTSLLALELEPADAGLVNRVFRSIHTIKGSGATAGFAHLAKFVHGLEEAFDLARAGRLAVTTDLIDCGLKACDVIREILHTEGNEGEAAGESAVTQAVTRLLPHAGSPHTSSGEAVSLLPASNVPTAYEIVFRPNRELFYSGTDPVTLLDELRELGSAHLTAHTDQIPVMASLDPECCYLWWEILLVTGRGEAAIRDVFSFVEDECRIDIRILPDQASAVALLGTVPAESLELFVLECEDHLTSIEDHALALERDPASGESLDALFRSVHSIKGNAGVLLGEIDGAALAANHPLHQLIRVTHALESLLDPCRGPAAKLLERETVQTALDAGDALRELLESLTHQTLAVPLPASLSQRLQLESEAAPASPPSGERLSAFLNTASQCVEMMGGCIESIESAGGSTESIQTYLRGLKMLASAAAYQKRPDLAEPVAVQLRILDAAMRAGGVLGDSERAALSGAFESACSVVEQVKRESSSAPGEAVPSPAIEAPALTATAAHPATAAAPATIRIEQEKLDRLMRVVGELLVARGAFPVLVEKLTSGGDPSRVAKELKEAGAGISRIADELQNSVMSIRMLPLKTVFQKFPRLVRDLARSLGKEVQFTLEGESIELDKTILEQIGDPLVHLIRNAVDHGLEAPDERKNQGKDPAGRVTLRARNEAGAVVIQVVDDGPGLDAEALKRKAVEKRLVSLDAAAAMDEAAAFQLIFLPGLTTAQKVTDISGRGVGMDVVRNNIRNLQGVIDIQSRRGRGTTFSVRLPTSLMVSKGILLEAGSEEYVLPLGSIRDMVKVPAEQVHQYRGSSMVQIRGEVHPVVSLAELFGLPLKKTSELSIAIVEAGKLRYGLIVDRFVSEVEVIVKPLAGGLEDCKEFQGAAIMGDGRVVLVLNPLECQRLQRAGSTPLPPGVHAT